ncbi:ATP-binding protein [Kitasatospora sp. NBC_00240]|uniref:ATP-binding protein n=1 Tax=Kitasatospora sp. NBC_00240 TaxID=2903567 RepID=UPI002253131E|nr:ATP-binding protein [Kitasatospora sp. NBC_00240]MCX5208371.1 ATP-binding protein [Kitasatospora sp. NBC_00240]
MTSTAVLPRPTATCPSRSDLTLSTHHLAGIRTLRCRLTEALESCGCTEDLIDSAALLATELLSNALRHTTAADTPRGARLDMNWDGHDLTIAVSDPDPLPPTPRTADPDDEGGRGTELLDALATLWGARPTTTGKTVWCVLT